MRVAYNGLFLGRPYTGMGQYTLHLLTALAHAKPSHRYVVLVPEPLPAGPAAAVGRLPGVEFRVVPPRRGWLGRGLALDHWESHDLAPAIKAAKAGLYHTPYPTPPLRTDVPVVMTVHDMIPWHLPEYRRGLKSGIKKSRQLAGIRSANRICTVSQTSKDDIVRFAKVDPHSVTVTYDGVDPYYAKPVPAATIRRVRIQFGLKRPYLLYYGGYDSRKNVRGLLDGFARSGLAKTHDLVLAGAVTAPATPLYADYAKLPDLVARHRLGRSVRRTGWLSDSDKRALLRGSAGFAYPSRAEGFGLPVLEALAAGAPVAAGQIPSTVELFGDAVILFDPEDPRAVGAGLRQLAEVDKTTAKLAAQPPATSSTAPTVPATSRTHTPATFQKNTAARRGRELAKRYSWAAVAENTLKTYTKSSN